MTKVILSKTFLITLLILKMRIFWLKVVKLASTRHSYNQKFNLAIIILYQKLIIKTTILVFSEKI